jgi:hypothetical protein
MGSCKKAFRELPGRPSKEWFMEDAYWKAPGAVPITAATAETFTEARMGARK